MLRNEIFEQRDVVLIRVEKLVAELDAQGSATRETQSQLETKIALLKRAIYGLPKEGKVVIKVKVLEPKPLMVLGVLRNWRIFFGTWSSTSRLQRRLIKMVIINSMYLSRDEIGRASCRERVLMSV